MLVDVRMGVLVFVLKESSVLREGPDEVLVLGEGTAERAHLAILVIVIITYHNILFDSLATLISEMDSLHIAVTRLSCGLSHRHVGAGTSFLIADDNGSFTVLDSDVGVLRIVLLSLNVMINITGWQVAGDDELSRLLTSVVIGHLGHFQAAAFVVGVRSLIDVDEFALTSLVVADLDVLLGLLVRLHIVGEERGGVVLNGSVGIGVRRQYRGVPVVEVVVHSACHSRGSPAEVRTSVASALVLNVLRRTISVVDLLMTVVMLMSSVLLVALASALALVFSLFLVFLVRLASVSVLRRGVVLLVLMRCISSEGVARLNVAAMMVVLASEVVEPSLSISSGLSCG